MYGHIFKRYKDWIADKLVDRELSQDKKDKLRNLFAIQPHFVHGFEKTQRGLEQHRNMLHSVKCSKG